MRYKFTPYSRLTLLIVAAVSALIAVGMSWGLFMREFPFDMRHVIVQARNTAMLIYLLPISWLAVWATQVHNPTSLVVGAAPGRSRLRVVVGQVVPLAVSTGVGWLAGWAPVCTQALTGQYWTPVDMVAMLTLAVGVASLVAVAFLVAVPFEVRVGAFAVPAAMLAVMLLPGYVINDWLGGRASTIALSYVWPWAAPTRGEQLLLSTEVLRLVFYLLVAFTVTIAAGGLAEFRTIRQLQALRAGSWLIFPTVVAVSVALIMPLLWVDDPNDQPSCQNDEGFTLCLYQIDEPARANIRGIITPMLALMPPEMVAKTMVTEG